MTNYYPTARASRILYDADRSSASSSDDASVTGWVKTAKFIVAVSIAYGSKATTASTFKLQWRNVTDGGSFADVGSSGEIVYASTSAVLSDENAVTSTEKRNSYTGGYSWQNGLEEVGNALTGSYSLASSYYTELQFAIDPASAHSGDQYEFRLWNNTASATAGTCVAKISMASVALGGVISTQSGLPGVAIISQALVGIIAAKHLLTPSARVAQSIAGPIITISVLGGLLVVEKKIAGAISTGMAFVGITKLQQALVGLCNVKIELTSSACVVQKMFGAISSATFSLGAAKSAIGLSGGFATNATITSVLHVGSIIQLVGEIVSWADFVAVSEVDSKIQGLICTSSLLTDSCSVFRRLIGEIVSANSVGALVSTYRQIIGSIVATSGLNGVPALFQELAGTACTSSPLQGGISAVQALRGLSASTSSSAAGCSAAWHLSGEIVTFSSLPGIIANLLALRVQVIVSSLLDCLAKSDVSLIGSISAISLLSGKTLSWKSMAGVISAIFDLVGAGCASQSIKGRISADAGIYGFAKSTMPLISRISVNSAIVAEYSTLIMLIGRIQTDCCLGASLIIWRYRQLVGSIQTSMLVAGSASVQKLLLGEISFGSATGRALHIIRYTMTSATSYIRESLSKNSTIRKATSATSSVKKSVSSVSGVSKIIQKTNNVHRTIEGDSKL
jgi:hypothetical protein